MIYRESERSKVESIRNEVFGDPGGGIFKKKKWPFVLQVAEKNLWGPIAKEAIQYFADNAIVWWPGSPTPTGHLLSSQISCLNHLFFLRADKATALRILRSLDTRFVEVCADFEGGYIGFEVVSKGSYLNETKPGVAHTRGANCTSIDAMMTGKMENGKKIQVVIEWKYTELYDKKCLADGPSGITRKKRYKNLIQDPSSPIAATVSLDNLYYEPFYQMMRQTLLAWQMVKNKKAELQCDDWLHFDVIPENNLHLRYRVQAPNLLQSGIEEAWRSQLKAPDKYRVITPQRMLKPILFEAKYRNFVNYLNTRYW